MTKQNLMNRRLKALELKIKGHTVRDIAEQLNVSPTTAHNDMLLTDIAKKDIHRANNNRMLVNERCEGLIKAYSSDNIITSL